MSKWSEEQLLFYWEKTHGTLPPKWRAEFLTHPDLQVILFFDSWQIKKMLKTEKKLDLLCKKLLKKYPNSKNQNWRNAKWELSNSDLHKIKDRIGLRAYQILVLRLGLSHEPVWTLQEIGDVEGITRERVRQIQEVALCKLRHPSFPVMSIKKQIIRLTPPSKPETI